LLLHPQKAYGLCNAMSYRITLESYIYFSLVWGLEIVKPGHFSQAICWPV